MGIANELSSNLPLPQIGATSGLAVTLPESAESIFNWPKNPRRVGVEKLLSQESAESRSRQDALQTIRKGRLDIFYPQIWLVVSDFEFSTTTRFIAN
jgi:hypothetical protein